MSYNTGNLSLFNQSTFTASSFIYGVSVVPTIRPLGSAQYTNVYINQLAPMLSGNGVSNFYGLAVSLSMNAPQVSMTSLSSVFLQTPTVTALTGGGFQSIYGLYVTAPSVASSGTITNNYTAFIAGGVGIGTTTPQNMLDVSGSIVIGTFAGSVVAPANSVLVSSSVGLGTTTPQYALDAQGVLSACQVLAPGTTAGRQKRWLNLGYNQGGFGGGAVGSNLVISNIAFDTSTIYSNSSGLSSSLFDGRYLYFNSAGYVFRYDSFSNFSQSSSYSSFNVNQVNSAFGAGANTASFDGRYAYFACSDSQTTLLRYDTFSSFTVTTSYSAFSAGLSIGPSVPSIGHDFQGSVFDGRYVYFLIGGTVGNQPLDAVYGQLLRYDTQNNFSLTSSWALFNYASAFGIAMPSNGPLGLIFDGRYIYIPAEGTAAREGSSLVRYDVTMSFQGVGSYNVFNTSTVSILGLTGLTGLTGGAFDGRFIYLIGGAFSAVTAYDITLPFTVSTSYNVLITPNWLPRASVGSFDGRYLYLGQAPGRYDTAGYSPSLQQGPPFFAEISCFTGESIYWLGAISSFMSRASSYPGPPTSPLSIGYSIGDFTVTGTLKLEVNIAGTASSGASGAMPSLAAGFVLVNISGALYKIPYF